MAAEQLGDDQDEVGRRRASRQLAGQADADDVRHRLVERLAEQDRLGLDATDAVAQDAEPVDHRGVGVGPDERVRERDAVAGLDDRGQELEVDLVDDARPRRHDPQIAERGLRPAQELVALAIALVLALDVERERARRAEQVDLDAVVDDEVGRDQRVDLGRVAADVGHRVAHDREVDDGGHAGEVLEDDPRGHERDLGLGRGPRPPGRQGLDVLGADDAATGMTEQILEQDPDRHGEAGAGQRTVQGRQAIDVRQAVAQARPGAERVVRRQRVHLPWLATLDAWKPTAPARRPREATDEGLARDARGGRGRGPRGDRGGDLGGRHRARSDAAGAASPR